MATRDFREAARFYDLERYEEAAQMAEQGIQRNPQDPYCYYILAMYYGQLSKRKKAFDLLGTAQKLDPNTRDSHYYSYVVNRQLGQPTRAGEHIREALRLAPNNASNHAGYALLLWDRRQYEPALKELDIALAIQPQYPSALKHKIKILTILGRRAEAEELSLILLKQNPDSSSPHAAAGLLALRKGQVDEAFASFREALRINPNSAEAREGVLEALRSKFVVYRWYYRLHTIRPGKSLPFLCALILLGGYGLACIENLKMPLLVPIVCGVVVVLLILLLLLMVFTSQITNMMLMFHPMGRLLLNAHIKAETSWFFGSLLLFFISIGGLIITHYPPFLLPVFPTIVSCFLMSLLSKATDKGFTRWATFGVFAAASVGSFGIYLIR